MFLGICTREVGFVCFRSLLLAGAAILSLPLLAMAQNSTPSQDTCQGPLFRAIYRRDIPQIEKLIDSGVNLNFRACSVNVTPLSESIVLGLETIPRKMIMAGADPNFAPEVTTPLILASWYCREDLVPLLLERGAAVDATDRDGNTALIAAAQSCEDERIAITILQAGAAVNSRSKHGSTALLAASVNKRRNLVKRLLIAGAEKPADPMMSDFVQRIANGEEVELPFRAPIQDDCGSPLLRAIYDRNLGQVDEAMARGADLNFKGCETSTTPLIEAIAVGLPKTAEKLILAGADPNLASDDGTTPLMVASWYRQKELVSLLLNRGAKVNAKSKEDDSALIHACQQSLDGAIVKLLLKAGAEVNIRTKYDSTPLTVAAFYGNEEAVKLLVEAGADLSAKTEEGTALEIARDREVGRTPAHDRIHEFLLDAMKRRSP